MQTLDFMFDFGSPATYLAWRQLPGVVARTGASVNYIPILLGAVFKATGNNSPAVVPAKGRYMSTDLARCAAREKIVFRMNPYFPINTISLMRGAAGYQLHHPAKFHAYLGAVFPAMWESGRNMGDQTVVAAVLNEAGLDEAGFPGLIAREDTKTHLKEATDRAVARGAFGAPTMFVGDQMYFGQDRMSFVEAALSEAPQH